LDDVIFYISLEIAVSAFTFITPQFRADHYAINGLRWLNPKRLPTIWPCQDAVDESRDPGEQELLEHVLLQIPHDRYNCLLVRIDPAESRERVSVPEEVA
jgi:hypothetical protein